MTPTNGDQHGFPISHIDPFADEVLAEPYETYASLRDLGAVVYLPQYDCYTVARHKDVTDVLRDWETFSSALGGIGLGDIRKPDAWRPAGPIVEADPPDHTRVRSVVQKLLSPAVIRSWRAQFQAAADELVNSLLEKEYIDGVKDVAEEYVFNVFPSVLGLMPTEGLKEKLVLMGELNFDGLGPRNARFLDTERRVQEILPWYVKSYQRENVLPGGFGEQIYLAGDSGEIDPAKCPGLLHSFLRGGMDTTVSTIGNVLWIISENPQLWCKLKENPDLCRAAFEETTRFESPIICVFRTTTKEAVFGDGVIPADSKVQVMLASANRDPRFWSDPDVYDMERSTARHVAFGSGIHMCIGQMIARMEGESVLRAFLDRVHEIEPNGKPVRRINNCLRSLKSLPLRIRGNT